MKQIEWVKTEPSVFVATIKQNRKVFIATLYILFEELQVVCESRARTRSCIDFRRNSVSKLALTLIKELQ